MKKINQLVLCMFVEVHIHPIQLPGVLCFVVCGDYGKRKKMVANVFNKQISSKITFEFDQN